VFHGHSFAPEDRRRKGNNKLRVMKLFFLSFVRRGHQGLADTDVNASARAGGAARLRPDRVLVVRATFPLPVHGRMADASGVLVNRQGGASHKTGRGSF
jgi:hypothetical protein